MSDDEKGQQTLGFCGARRRIRTTDTRIFNPLPQEEITTPYGEKPPRTDQERKGKVENAPSPLVWRTNANGTLSAVIGGVAIATVSRGGWWSSYLLSHSGPCASMDAGKAAVEAAWADWMDRAGLVCRGGA